MSPILKRKGHGEWAQAHRIRNIFAISIMCSSYGDGINDPDAADAARQHESEAMNQSMFTSNKTSWSTPQDFFDKLDAEFHFGLDPCAAADNAKCLAYFDESEDGLSHSWQDYGAVFMNPPYGRGIGKWLQKAHEEARRGTTVVCLVPARTDTAWWHDYCMRGEVRFVRGRLKFSGSKINAPFPCAVVIFRPMPLGVEAAHGGE